MRSKSKDVVNNKGAVSAVRLTDDLDQRLAKAAFKLDVTKIDIVRHSVRAIVEAIEAADYSIQWPPKAEFITHLNAMIHGHGDDLRVFEKMPVSAAIEIRYILEKIVDEKLAGMKQDQIPPVYGSKLKKRKAGG